jgi:hypothetical protein
MELRSIPVRVRTPLVILLLLGLAGSGGWALHQLQVSAGRLAVEDAGEAARQAVATGGTAWAILLVAIAGLSLLVASLVLLQWRASVRLSRLSARLAEIGRSSDPLVQVDGSSGDAVGRLGSEINRMLAVQRDSRAEISRRNAAMRLIFDNLPIGLLALDVDGRVQGERSSATGDLLGRHDLDGAELGELLAPGPQGVITRRRLVDFLRIVSAGNLAAEELDEINPVKVVTIPRGDGPLVLRLRFYRIEAGSGTTRRFRRDVGIPGEPDGVLVTMSDISDERRLAAEVERSQEDYLQLKSMAEDVELFHGFLASSRREISQLSDIAMRMGASPDRVQLSDLQRGVRALREGGAIFRLAALEQAARSFDADLGSFLAMTHLSDAEVRRCRYGIADLEAAITGVEHQFRALLGTDERAPGPATLFGSASPPPTPETLRVRKRSMLTHFAGLQLQPARLALAPVMRQVGPMARRRGIEVHFAVHGEEVQVDHVHHEALNQLLPHLLRFALDHGIDSTAKRAQAGKPAIPQLTLGLERQARHLVITVADDGNGIDPTQLRQLAVQQGLLSSADAAALSDPQAQELVFRIDYDSGDGSRSGVRHVGMNLIIQRLREELAAEVTVRSTAGHGTAVVIGIPLPSL